MRAAADRSVDHVDARAAGDRLGGARASRGVDDEDRAGRHGGDEIAVQADLLHLLIGEHADDDGIGALGDGGQARSPRCAPNSLTARALLGGATERADLVAGFDEAAHHGRAHAARTDEADPRHRGCSIDVQRGIGRVEHRTLGAEALSAMLAAWRTSFCSSAPAIGASASRVPPNAAMLLSAMLCRRPAGEDLAEPVRGQSKGFAQFEGADRAAQVGGEQQVVQDLGDLAAAQRTEMDDRVGVGCEHRAAPLDDVVVAADHDQQLALFDGRRRRR